MELKNEMEKPAIWPAAAGLPEIALTGEQFGSTMRATGMAMLITDPNHPDNPIVFANNAFLKLTGYERSEIIGANCRFLQGVDTDPAMVEKLRDAVANRKDVSIDILNYRKDGSPFWNALFISPVYGADDQLQYFFSSQLDVTDRKNAEFQVQADKDRFEQAVAERTRELETALETKTALLHEVDHRVKNNLQMISSLIAVQSRTIDDESIRRSLHSMLERVEALSTVHRKLYQSDDVSTFDVADFARDLVTDLTTASGRAVTTRLELTTLKIPAAKAAPIALILNELVTNVLKHAFAEGESGEITVKVDREDDNCIVEVIDNGRGMNSKDSEPKQPGGSFGTRLIRSIGRQLDGEISWSNETPGTRAVLSFPAEPDQNGRTDAS